MAGTLTTSSPQHNFLEDMWDSCQKVKDENSCFQYKNVAMIDELKANMQEMSKRTDEVRIYIGALKLDNRLFFDNASSHISIMKKKQRSSE